MTCPSCIRGFHWECDNCDECHTVAESPLEINDEREEKKTTGRGNALDSNLKTPNATGRMRAAQLYPLDRTQPCEWRGKENCGGGKHPIKGCVGGLQLNRHHGPDKSPLNNDPDNVSRICTQCHSDWHRANDKDYSIADMMMEMLDE